MKNIAVIAVVIMSIVFTSCSTMKNAPKENDAELAGTWTLTYITGPRITFDGLYPGAKPTLNFDFEKSLATGNNSCNSYGATIIKKENKMKFEKGYSTMMACPGDGESVYMSTLNKIDSYKVEGNTLSLYMDEVEMMRFTK